MIHNSFIFLEKISTKKEQNIWKQNIHSWNSFIKKDKIKGISKEKKYQYNRILQQAQTHLNNNNLPFFNLPQKEMWRFYNFYKEECCYADIEVDSYGNIIVIGISDHYNTNFFVKGVNLDNVQNELDKYKIIITFNGGAFDLPKMKKQLKIQPPPHIDLKPLCVNINLKGGLKEIEKTLNLNRPSNLYGNPVTLWKAFHASGDKEYLDLLLEYNREDVENLKHIADIVYQKMCEKVYKQHIST
jgi:uncharacterized protein